MFPERWSILELSSKGHFVDQADGRDFNVFAKCIQRQNRIPATTSMPLCRLALQIQQSPLLFWSIRL